MSTGKVELSVGAIANKYEIFTEEELYNINVKVPELDERVGNIEDDIDEINSSLEDTTNEVNELKEVKADKSYVDSAIESVDVSSQLTNYAKKSDLEVKADKSYVDSAIESVDVSSQLTNYATKTDLSLKVDKETGKSLISDSEIERLSTLKNYDDTEIKNSLNSKANKTELHSHSNKSVLDGITSTKITEWDSKSNFSGNYNDLTNKPTIPTLNGYATEQYVNEEIKKIDVTEQLTDYAKKSDLHSHTNKTVLDGITSTKITEWNNKSNFSGNYNDLTNKPTIPAKTSQLTNDSGFITTVPSEYVTDSELNSKGYLTEHQDISGKVDKVNGYSLISDAEISRLATLENYNDTEVRELIDETNASLDKSVTFKVVGEGTTVPSLEYATKSEVNSLTLGVHTDGLIYLFKGGKPVGIGVAQSTTILPDGDVVGYVDSTNNIVLSGNLSNGTYNLKYEMEDGSLIDVGQIVKEGGSGTPTIGYTNVLYLAQEYASSSIYNDKGWKEGVRHSGSVAEMEKPLANHYLTGYIPCTKESIIRIKNIDIETGVEGYYLIIFCKGSDKSEITATYLKTMFSTPADDDGVYMSINPGYLTAINTSSENNFYFRICAYKIDDTSIITVDEEIEGQCLNKPNTPSEPSEPGVYTNLANPLSSDWLTNKRLSTGGTIKDGEGCTITNYITCKGTDVIRIKGLSMENFLPTGTSSQIEEYNIDGTRIDLHLINDTISENKTHIASVDSNGVVTYIVQNTTTTKIRICGTTPSNVNDVIITVNQKIE